MGLFLDYVRRRERIMRESAMDDYLAMRQGAGLGATISSNLQAERPAATTTANPPVQTRPTQVKFPHGMTATQVAGLDAAHKAGAAIDPTLTAHLKNAGWFNGRVGTGGLAAGAYPVLSGRSGYRWNSSYQLRALYSDLGITPQMVAAAQDQVTPGAAPATTLKIGAATGLRPR